MILDSLNIFFLKLSNTSLNCIHFSPKTPNKSKVDEKVQFLLNKTIYVSRLHSSKIQTLAYVCHSSTFSFIYSTSNLYGKCKTLTFDETLSAIDEILVPYINDTKEKFNSQMIRIVFLVRMILETRTIH